MEIYDVLFDASSTVPIESKGKHEVQNIGIKEGMANVGDQRDEVLRVDRKLFRSRDDPPNELYDELGSNAFSILQTGK